MSAELPDGLLEFVWDRLPIDSYDLTKSCLAEDWFVEAAIDAESPFRWRGRNAETSHRLLYRHAWKTNIERCYPERNPEYLMLNQMVALLPAMFGAAQQIGIEQGIAQ